MWLGRESVQNVARTMKGDGSTPLLLGVSNVVNFPYMIKRQLLSTKIKALDQLHIRCMKKKNYLRIYEV